VDDIADHLPLPERQLLPEPPELTGIAEEAQERVDEFGLAGRHVPARQHGGVPFQPLHRQVEERLLQGRQCRRTNRRFARRHQPASLLTSARPLDATGHARRGADR